MSCSTSSSLSGSASVRGGLGVRLLSSLESVSGVSSSSGVKLPGEDCISGSYPAAISSSYRLLLYVGILRAMSGVRDRMISFIEIPRSPRWPPK